MITVGDIRRARVLIVDDLPANVLLLERMLHGAGYQCVTSTSDPEQVCRLHRENLYDLILLDLEMPRMDGFQVMEGLKKIEKDGYLPVLVITAQTDHKVRALKAGAKDFVSKPLDVAEVLTRVHNMIEVRLLHTESRRLYSQVLAEKKVSERLLLNVLPHSVAERLKAETGTIVDSFEEVTVLFADIVGFTQLSSGMTPEQLVAMLNDVFTVFDGLAEKWGLEKIKTIGDAYMAVAGLHVLAADHATRAANMALDMIAAVEHFAFQMRIGLHSGAAVAGVIGKHKFIYDLWGDAVNTASRMESHGLPNTVHCSQATREHLIHPRFTLECRGQMQIKGKGEMTTWLVKGPPRGDPAKAR